MPSAMVGKRRRSQDLFHLHSPFPLHSPNESRIPHLDFTHLIMASLPTAPFGSFYLPVLSSSFPLTTYSIKAI